jgi:hypothetical protein
MKKKERESLKRECRAALEEGIVQFQRVIRALGYEVTRDALVGRMKQDYLDQAWLFTTGRAISRFSSEDLHERMTIASEVIGEIETAAVH